MKDWQPIETAPKDGTVIDVWVKDLKKNDGSGQRRTHVWWSKNADRWSDDWLHVPRMFGVKPTHWMPLPEPPP